MDCERDRSLTCGMLWLTVSELCAHAIPTCMVVGIGISWLSSRPFEWLLGMLLGAWDVMLGDDEPLSVSLCVATTKDLSPYFVSA